MAKWWIVACILLLPIPAGATVHVVEPGGPLPTLSAALLAATDGDIIRITAGKYSEGKLYVWHHNLTIEAATEPPLLSRTAFVVAAPGFHLRRIVIDGQRRPELQNLLHFLYPTDALVEDCTIKNPGGGTGSGELGDLYHQAPLAEFNDSAGCVRIAAGRNMTFRSCDFSSDRNDTVPNEANFLSYPVGEPAGGFLIEDCTFAAQCRNVILIDSHQDITIRRCSFARTASGSGDRLGLSAFATSAVVVIPTTPETPSVFRNLQVEGSRFSGIAGVSILFYNGSAYGCEVLDNTFDECFGPNVLVKCRGDGMLVRGNRFRLVPAPDSVGAVIETATPEAPPEGAMLSRLLVCDNRFAEANGDAILARPGEMEQRVEKNVFQSIPAWCWRAGGDAAHLLFADNLVDGGSLSGTEGAVSLSGSGNVVRGNRFLRRVGGLEFVTYGAIGGNNLVADNLLAYLSAYGIRERGGAFAANRYFNNTFAGIAGPALELHSAGVAVFNNIFAQNQAGLASYDSPPGVSDFNLFFANGPGGTAHHLGLATSGAHDRFADPRFLDAPGDDFRLGPGSPARNAGTSPTGPLDEPDFLTDLGAFQDQGVDTRVPQGQWEQYR